ncbi:MAG: glycosyltransferase family 39 protein [Alphaproteobacteria bacterium]|nr:MAG: glycosyltransferase family 39 protein [Alphaproteobacteria bacterium]
MSNATATLQPRHIWTFMLARPYLCLAIVALLLFLPGLFSLPPIDRDESRFAQATAQMLETGNYIEIKFLDEPRHKKPIGIHWLQALSVSALSAVEDRQIWAYRLPSLLGALIAVWLTFWGGRRLFGDETALLGALWLAASIIIAAESNLATTDAVLLACVTAIQMTLGRIYLDHCDGGQAQLFRSPGVLALLLWIALGFGLLIKGPMAPLVLGLTVVTLCLLDRQWLWLKRLSPLPGIVIILVIVLPWSAAIWQATDGGFFVDALTNDMAAKIISGQEGHGAPPGTYLLASPLLLWPASLVLGPAALLAWRRRHDPAVRFCLAWIIPSWLFFELLPTKLPHYVLPLLPPIMLLCAAGLKQISADLMAPEGAYDRAIMWGMATLWLAVTGGLAIGIGVLPIFYGDGLSGLLVACAVIFFAAAVTAFLALAQGNWLKITLAGMVVAALFNWSLLQGTLPLMTQFQISTAAAEAIARHHKNDTPVAVAGYSEPSLVFLLGTDTKLGTGQVAADHIATTPGSLALVESAQEDAFLSRLAQLNATGQAIETVVGINYSRGQNVTLTLYRATPQDALNPESLLRQ